MDRVTLIDKGIVFNTRFAAPSILTGYFVASVIGATREQIEAAFTEPGDILVENAQALYETRTYTGYHYINEIREGQGEITVILTKEYISPPAIEETEPEEQEGQDG